ncbi:MAG: putative metal-binding motif-containing protein [Deltaproteobacteria bacterium]|nr:putative metal-binding motif-containing protein [Deltaproteobacteria bacterium]
MRFRLLFLSACAAAACDPTEVATKCAESDLIAQCPPGSNPELGAAASVACGGHAEGDLLEQSGSVSAQCNGSGDCRVLCQFQVPCTCGVERIDRDGIRCSDCGHQSCGDGRCEGTERATCAPNAMGCAPCEEDCGGATCGDRDCTGDESPTTCPQDCARDCNPGDAPHCEGAELVLCSADGERLTTDCQASGSVCGPGGCVPAGVCGNGVCEPTENSTGCPSDCASVCVPSSRDCTGNTLVVCAADGRSKTETDCAVSQQVCASGACVSAGVCGNGACEAGENATDCPSDCQIICGNRRCETGERVSCPRDCTVCGNGQCEENESTTCPQDCGICEAGARECLGPVLRVCNANGSAQTDVDCSTRGQTCGRGNCVPIDVCGNGLCEPSDGTTCGVDCADRCGDEICGASESFSTCSVDCGHVCGDGVCDLSESTSACPQDCQLTCGNNNCDTFERDATASYCGRDCGFCGDGTCQDGFETPADRAVGGLAPCPADCVVLECSGTASCGDRITCTDDTCDMGSGACVYVPNDAACAGGKCLGRLSTNPNGSGCCSDGDADGFAATSCGGTDCNDNDNTTRPGAVEACGGPDRNCNGQNRPASRAATQLTTDFDGKDGFAVAAGAGVYGAVWVDAPLGVRRLVAAIIQPNGTMSAPITLDDQVDTVPDTSYGMLGIAYSSGRSQFAVVWVSPSGRASLNWIDPNTGAAARGLPLPLLTGVQLSHVYDRGKLSMAYQQGVLLLNFSIANPFVAVADDETVTIGGNYSFRTFAIVPAGNAFVAVKSAGGDGGGRVAPRILSVDSSGQTLVENILGSGGDTMDVGTPVMWDGAAALVVSSYGQAIRMERFTVAANQVLDANFQTPAARVLDAVFIPDLQLPQSSKVAILHADDNSLSFTIRNLTGGRVLDTGTIAAANAARKGRVFFDGSNFTAIWSASSGGVDQLFMSTIACQ